MTFSVSCRKLAEGSDLTVAYVVGTGTPIESGSYNGGARFVESSRGKTDGPGSLACYVYRSGRKMAVVGKVGSKCARSWPGTAVDVANLGI